jgi:hypothetical protein
MTARLTRALAPDRTGVVRKVLKGRGFSHAIAATNRTGL